MTSDTARRNASLVSKCLLRCHSSIFQYSKKGECWKFLRRRLCAPKKTSLTVGFVVLEKGDFMAGECPACPPQGKGRGRLGRACGCAAPTSTPRPKCFCPFPLQWVCLVPAVISTASRLLFFSALFRHCSALPPAPCRTATAEAIKPQPLGAEKGTELRACDHTGLPVMPRYLCFMKAAVLG